MAVRFALESLTESLWDEAMPLLIKHWREVSHFQDIPLEPDVARYHAFAQAGVLRVFTARDDVAGNDRTVSRFINQEPLVGYALYIVNTNAHYKSSLQAVQDVVFVDPAYRGGTGYRFIKFCDEQLAAEGVQVVMHHVKAKPELNFGPLLERQGYELVDLIFAKRLDVPPPVARTADSETSMDEAFV